ncbi:FAD-dependent oxidoreductase [Nocardia sp. BMG111209]|uniref:FAD-dependent oxidoreductase n=1 Tax=Nocardia sp. BMG111209 TaxID=1160137 RepID=UPI000374ACED|nr:FAD-dependent oxidoreductase [Nocardia sp. BMG111209]
MSATEYDVVCVGGGLGGLAAAVRAHDLGARVLVLERSTMIGGVAAYSGGFCWVGANHLDDGTDTLAATEDYLDQVQGSGRPVDRAARREYLESAIEATRWFTAAGVPFSLIRDAADLYEPCAGSTSQGRLLEVAVPGSDLGPWRDRLRPSVYYRTGVTRDESYHVLAGDLDARLALAAERERDDLLTHGLGLAAGFAREALVRRGVECRLEHRVVALRHENDRVTGVIAEGPDGPVEITATRGVLLAVGGYGNASDAAELEDVPELIEASPPVVSGDGLTLGQSVGATVVRGADPFVVLGARFEGRTHPGSDEPLFSQLLENLGFPHSIVVNRDGHRFGDESYYGALIRGLRTFDSRHKRWANFPCWLVFDESFRRHYPLGPYPPGADYPADVLRFDSLADLAAGTGIDAAGLTATVARFDDFAAAGEDTEFGRGSLPFARKAYGDPRYPNPNLGAIATAPYYAVPLHVLGVGLCSLGLAIDPSARVLRRDGSPIAGLYATGNAAATRELKGYVTGLANARNYTYAYRAVNDMFVG